jgi:hypothetical protein
MREEVVVLVEELEARAGIAPGCSGPTGSVVIRSPSGPNTPLITVTAAFASVPSCASVSSVCAKYRSRICSRIS